MSKSVVIYARISVALEESVSISRQLEAGRKYAESRGWSVVAEYVDDGVSASQNSPEARNGWRQLLQHEGHFDAVVVWKVDRLARRVLDFLRADETLQNRGAAIVAVDDPIDMTTPQGRAFATMLAVFGELEAAAISARVAAARTHLLRSGRAVGGSVPYGWMNMPNPNGHGQVLAKDPDRIDVVAEIASQLMSGATLYSVKKWLDEADVPLPRISQSNRKSDDWAYSTVDRLVRNPILAGMVPFNPGNKSKVRGQDVLRDSHGLPVINEDIAIMTPADHRLLIAKLDSRDSPQARPRASKKTTSPLLSMLVHCHHCDRFMNRGTTQGRPSLSCPSCHQTVSNLERHIENRLKEERADRPVFRFQSVAERSPELSEIEAAIHYVTGELRRDDADVGALIDQLEGLKQARASARGRSARAIYKLTGETVAEAWEAAADDPLERRRILVGQVKRISVRRGKGGRYFDQQRLMIDWLQSELRLPNGSLVAMSREDSAFDATQSREGQWFEHEDGLYFSPE